MNEEERNRRIAKWERSRRRWYNFYFFLGIGINFLLYFTKPYGFDPSGSLVLGSFFGIGIPLSTMLLGVKIHQRIIGIC